MTIFEERENAFENKYIHDEYLRFKIFSRRNRLLFIWAIEKACEELDASDLNSRADDFALKHMKSTEGDVAQALMKLLELQQTPDLMRDIRQKMALLWENAAKSVVESKGSWLH